MEGNKTRSLVQRGENSWQGWRTCELGKGQVRQQTSVYYVTTINFEALIWIRCHDFLMLPSMWCLSIFKSASPFLTPIFSIGMRLLYKYVVQLKSTQGAAIFVSYVQLLWTLGVVGDWRFVYVWHIWLMRRFSWWVNGSCVGDLVCAHGGSSLSWFLSLIASFAIYENPRRIGFHASVRSFSSIKGSELNWCIGRQL